MIRKTPEQRFWRFVQKTDGCWLWTGAQFNERGYGAFQVAHKKTVRAHRYAYQISNGSIPHGMFVCHSCDNPRCVNPAHLWLGTAQDNVTDKVLKGRSPLGEATGVAKLTPTMVIAIRSSAAGTPRKTLAARFGVTVHTISAVKRNLVWKHIPQEATI